MSFIPSEGGASYIGPPGYSSQHSDGLEDKFQSISLEKSKPKKKRPVRAFHTEFNSPDISNASTGFPSPNLNRFDNIQQTQHFASPVQPMQSPQGHNLDPKDHSTNTEDIQIAEYRFKEQQRFMSPINEEDSRFQTFYTFEHAAPPTAGTQFHTVDQGTSSSKFMRSTMYFVPESENLRQATKLPVAVTITPFASLLDTEEPVPVVDMQQLGVSANSDSFNVGPPRCSRCRTYINSSMQFTNSNKFTCNICQFSNNSVPDDYSSFLDGQGYRVDKYNRPELHKGVYDLIVPKEYNFGGAESTNHPMHYVFLIDISEQSIRQNLPVLIADSIRATLYSSQFSEGADLNDSPKQGQKKKIAIITFDKRIHYYNLSSILEATQISISADLDDPFVPFSEGLFADPEDSRIVIEDTLNHLEQLNSQSHAIADAEPCFAAACRAAMMCLESVGGGKIVSLLSSLPSWGPGGLKFKDNRNVGRTPTSESEQNILSADNQYYKALAKDFLTTSVGLDCLVVSHASVDLSNIGWLCSVTGGSVSKWSNFDFERDSRAFTGKFHSLVTGSKGYQGQLKLRCSNGLQVSQYYGTSSSIANTSVSGNVQDPVIPVLHENQSFTVLLTYDGKLNTKYDCHFQAALLYTDPEGVRKVRVINLVLAVAERLEDVFNLVDEDAVVTAIVRDSLSFVGSQPLTEIRESINEKLVSIFTQYRAMSELGNNQSRGSNQLLFPENLKHLPMYLLSFIKSKAIRNSSSISADSRLADLYEMLNIPIERLLYKLYPALIELHSMADDEGIFENQHGFIKLPKFKDLSTNKLEYGVYILCDGERVIIWVHPNSNILLMKDLFGENIEDVQQIDPLMDELPDLPTHISMQARNIIKYFHSKIIGSQFNGTAGIQLIRHGIDTTEQIFKDLLVEDSLNGSIIASSGPSYPEYLTNLHKAIRVKLENEKSSTSVKQSLNQVQHKNDTLAQRMIFF